MTISILTLFPEMFVGPFSSSILKRAKEKNFLQINLINIRDFSTDKHKTVDDRPYGGGAGMILKVDVVDRAIQSVLSCEVGPRRGPTSLRKERIILLDPQGKPFAQRTARRLVKFDHLILICGHYEGVDERVRKLVDEEISIGDYVLTGGEIPAMVITDAVTRLIPGVLSKEEVTQLESFSPYTIGQTPYTLLEYPQYTRPPLFKSFRVPAVLLSGNHLKIREWREKQALKRTRKRRPDLVGLTRRD